MTTIMLNVYAGHSVNASKVVAIVSYSSNLKPLARLKDEIDKKGLLIDICSSKKAKSLIILDSGDGMLTPVSSEALNKRLSEA